MFQSIVMMDDQKPKTTRRTPANTAFVSVAPSNSLADTQGEARRVYTAPALPKRVLWAYQSRPWAVVAEYDADGKPGTWRAE